MAKPRLELSSLEGSSQLSKCRWVTQRGSLDLGKVEREDEGARRKKRPAEFQNKSGRDFTNGPVVKNLPSNARDMGLIPGRGAKNPHVARQLSRSATTRETPLHRNGRSCMPQLRPDAAK